MTRIGVILIFILMTAAGLTACGLGFDAKNGANLVRLPWPQADGTYRPQNVPLLSLGFPGELSSPRAKVYFRTGAGADGFRGHTVRPRVARYKNVWRPLDTDSLMSLAAFAVMERLYDFDDRFGMLERLKWPRVIGVEIPVRTSMGAIINNALYDADKDVIAVAPYHAARVPVSVNHGIMAHEHFHAHFAAAWRKIGGLKPVARGERPPLQVVNRAVIAGWNEGLADYYAFVFTGNADYLRGSLPDIDAFERELSGEIRPMYSWENMNELLHCAATCKSSRDDISYSYHIGTAMARFLYRWGISARIAHDDILALVHQRLPDFIASLQNRVDADPILPAELLVDLVNHSIWPMYPETCASLRQAIGYYTSSVPRCM
jgi:hypothetical protein